MSRDLQVGRRGARIAATTSLLGAVVIVLIPQTAKLIALVSWSDEKQEACNATAGCAVTVLPWETFPGWVGVLWPAILIACLVISWKPQRWWIPQTPSGESKQPGVYSTPEWVRGMALVAAIVNLGLTIGLGKRSSVLQNTDYVWGLGLSIVAIVLATICIAVTARSIPQPTRDLLAATPGFWLLPPERRKRRRGMDYTPGERARRR